VLEAIREGQNVSRADIARSTGLARSTVSTLVSELQQSGIVVEREEGGRAARGSGRPPTLLSLEPAGSLVLGIHFDHPYVRVALADAQHTILAEAGQALDTDTAGPDALDAAARLAGEVTAQAGVEESRIVGAGVAMAGPLERETGQVAATGVLPGWRGVSVADELSARLGGIPVHVDNDANLGALAETVLGAGRGARELAYVMVSSGVGCGLVLDGRLYRGAGGTAGEMGHVLVDEQGPMCRCGNRGCLETYAGGDALVQLLRPSHGADFTLPELIARAREGDPGCVRAIADAGRWIGQSVATLCNCLSLERIVVGGELASAGELLLGPLRETVRRYALPSVSERLEIVEGELHGRAELLGALVLVVGRSEQPLSGALRTAVGT
jgi:predicted NBD/HSP70 family sugar kinase/biotin operon repressor